MKILKTKNGDWRIDINFLALKKIRARVMRRNGEPLDLMNIVKFSADGGVDTSILDELADDSLLLLELVYTILQLSLLASSHQKDHTDFVPPLYHKSSPLLQ